MNDFAKNWYEIRDNVFDGPTMGQKKVVSKFDDLDAILRKQIALLTLNTDFVETNILDIFREIAAGQSRNRVFFCTRKSKQKLMGYRKDEIIHLENMAELYVYGLYRNKLAFLQKLFEIPFIRLIYENLIESYLHYSKEYQDASRETAALHSKLLEGQAFQQIPYERSLKRVEEIEALLLTQPTAVYGVVEQLRELYDEYQIIRNEIAVPYLRVVYSMAKKHASTQIQFFDNFQNGTVGLLYAISGYSKDKSSFGSYACWWVRQQILYNMKADINLIRIPISLWETFSFIEKMKAQLGNEGNDIKALATATGYTEKKIKDITEQVKIGQPYSLNHYIDNEHNNCELKDVILDLEHEDRLERNDKSSSFFRWLHDLTPDERTTYILSHGFLDWIPDQPIDNGALETERTRQLAAAVFLKIQKERNL